MITSHIFFEQITLIISKEPRLQWLLVNQRAVLDHNTMWSDGKIGRYARLVDGLVSPLARSGRLLQAVCFQFGEEAHLMVVHRDLRLCFVLPGESPVIDEIASAAMILMRECDEDIHELAGIEYEPEDEVSFMIGGIQDLPDPGVDIVITWPDFRGFLLDVIGKILSRPQAERLIGRELSGMGIAGTPEWKDFEQIGRRVVAHVPHRGKQAALLTEVFLFLETDS